MKNLKLISCAVALLSGANAFAIGQGYSTFPMMANKKIISTEATGITSSGGGVGAQVRFTYKANDALTFDTGMGLTGGDRDGSVFGSADYEIFPDFMKQPRFSVKGQVELSKEFGESRTKFSVAPTLSKGFNFWGKEAFPYVSIPVGLKLNGESKTYDGFSTVNLGITGKLPFEGYRNLLGMTEMQVNLRGQYTALVMGVSFPMN